MRTILITGIGGLTQLSISTIIKENHPDYRLVDYVVEKKAMGFFMKAHKDQKLIDKYYVVPRFEDVEGEIGFSCWIRTTEGTRGLGSLRLDEISFYKSWFFINSRIPKFTVSEFLTGRHLADQMLYYKGEYVKGAALQCVEYVMANTAPSRVTGSTHFGRFLKVTEVNIRHMAYTGVMVHMGFVLIEDTIRIHEDGNADNIKRDPYHHYEKLYIFLRDVDVEPIVLECEDVFDDPATRLTRGHSRYLINYFNAVPRLEVTA